MIADTQYISIIFHLPIEPTRLMKIIILSLWELNSWGYFYHFRHQTILFSNDYTFT